LDGDAVVATIKAHGIPSVRGNHDHQSRHNQRWMRQHLAPTAAVCARLLKPETLEYVTELPATLNVVVADVHIVVAHGIPSNDVQYLYPTSRRSAFESAMRKAQEVDPNVDVLILGHTHLPMMVRVLDRWIFNPGSVAGLHTSGSNTCATLTLPDCKFEVFDLVTGMRIVPPLIQVSQRASTA
jgi:predicted phosphodiesterase